MKLLALALTVAVVQGSPSPPALSPETRDRVSAAITAYQAHDCTTVLRSLDPLLKTGAAERTNDQAASAILSLGAICEAVLGQGDKGYGLAVRATQRPGAQFEIWMIRIGPEIDGNRFAEAAATIRAMAAGDGAALNKLQSQWLWKVVTGLEAAGEIDRRRALLQVLAESYDPDPADGSSDGFRREFAGLLFNAGDVSGAGRMISGISDPLVLRRIMVDPRLRMALPKSFDIRKATERRLERDRGLMASQANMLKWVVAVCADLRQLGRVQEALALLESTRQNVKDGKFSDLEEFRPWWWNALAYAQRASGETDNAIASMKAGMTTTENGGRNVSQVINLAALFNSVDRPQDALTVLNEPIGVASPYGEMQRRGVRGCAYAMLNRRAEAAADRDYLVVHRIDAKGAAVELLLCMGDYDAAAADVIARLSDPDERPNILLDFSDYDDPPVKLPKSRANRAFEALAARADVKAALARAGGTIKFDVQPTTN